LISDADGALRRRFGGGRITYLIDKQGIVRFVYKGIPDNELLLRELEQLIP